MWVGVKEFPGMRTWWMLLILLVGFALPARAEEAAPEGQPMLVTVEPPPYNLRLATYGGKQFWTDLEICQGWRIQRNAVTGHCRLLDAHDVRQAWGTLEQCEARFEQIKRDKGLQPPRGKVVITMHGLLRSRHQLEGLCDFLAKEGEYEVINFGYASSRAEVGEHAAALARVVSRLSEAEEINFVAHSLGNIVLRHYLHDCRERPDPRIKRIVMLGPPNNGAEFAKRFSESTLFQMVWGKSGQQLADNWARLEPCLATPSCEFGIIAGGVGTAVGLNPIVTGDDDGVVSVQETKLAGASDFLVVPVVHGDLMDEPSTQKSILRFLREGCFVSPEKRQPLAGALERARSDHER